MASTLLAYILGTPKGKHSVRNDSVTKDGPSSHTPATRTLPTELWIHILNNAPRVTLAQVMLVNRSLSEVGECILYRSVVLKWHAAKGRKFRRSIASCPRRATLVAEISITLLDDMDDRLPFELPQLLMALPNLRSVSLMTALSPVRCDSVFSDVRLPHLRSFATNVTISSSAALFAFLAAHAELDTLDLQLASAPDLPASELQEHLAARPFASLRALACSSRCLNSRAPVLGSLMHLHRTRYLAPEVAHIAALLGPQLVSLRLGGRLIMGNAGASAGRTELRWALDEVAAKFPRLRYLQVDTPYKERPYLDTSVVDWLRPCPATGGPPDAAMPAQKLTIAWTYADGFWSDSKAWAATYDAFLDDAALQCLKEWHGYVERVVYERSIRPYPMVSVMLKAGSHDGEEEVVRVQDADIGWGDYWKRA